MHYAIIFSLIYYSEIYKSFIASLVMYLWHIDIMLSPKPIFGFILNILKIRVVSY